MKLGCSVLISAIVLGFLAACLGPILLVIMIAGAVQSFPSPSDLAPNLPTCKHCIFLGDTIQIPPGPHGPAIAQAAIDDARHLHGIPDNQYDAGIPTETMSYWQTACPPGSSCWIDWQSGNLQCVLFVMGAFALAHARGQADMLPVSGNAVDYAALYANRPGWQEIQPGQGWPQIGDAVVWGGNVANPYGHIAIIVKVTSTSVIIAQGNGIAPLEKMPLFSNGVINDAQWGNGYQQLAYIRDTPNT